MEVDALHRRREKIAAKYGSVAADNWARSAISNNLPGDLKRKYNIDPDTLRSGQLFDLWREKLEDDGRYGTFFNKVPGTAEDWEGRPVDLYSEPWRLSDEGSNYRWNNRAETEDARTLNRMGSAIDVERSLRNLKKPR
jgi:hypothetical protein